MMGKHSTNQAQVLCALEMSPNCAPGTIAWHPAGTNPTLCAQSHRPQVQEGQQLCFLLSGVIYLSLNPEPSG